MVDRLHINTIRAYGYTGFLPEEQTLGQWFTIDLTVWLDTAQAVQTDELGYTYDYSTIIQEIQNLVQTARFKLIERLAGAIADHILQANPVEQVQVRLTKERPPIPHFTGNVTIEITRTR